MDSNELLVLAVLGFFVLYGLFNIIAPPILERKFYRAHKFERHEQSIADTTRDSLLLGPLVTKQLYQGMHKNSAVLHAKFMLQRLTLLTFSKNKRKQLQLRWSASIVPTEHSLSKFMLLPKTDPSTVVFMVSEAGVDLSVDRELDSRYFLMTEHTEPVLTLLLRDIREFLLGRDLASIEVLENAVIIKRTWPSERFEQSVLADLQCATLIAEKLSAKKS